jgi:large subunit ribosomal protein L19
MSAKRPNPSELMKKAEKAVSGTRASMPSFSIGDVVKVHVKVKEGEKTRIQIFEGLVIRQKRGGNNSCFTVRKISYTIGVERIFPYNSPTVDKVQVVSRGEVRRAKLYYLRDLKGRAARVKSDLVFGAEAEGTPAGEAGPESGAPIQAQAVQA